MLCLFIESQDEEEDDDATDDDAALDFRVIAHDGECVFVFFGRYT